MPRPLATVKRFADALEAKANAKTQAEEDVASDELIEVVGEIEQNAAETAVLLKQLLLLGPTDAEE